MNRHEPLPMRFARVRAGIRRRIVWNSTLTRFWRSPLPKKPSPKTPDGYRNRDPRRDLNANIAPKYPSAAIDGETSNERPSRNETAAPGRRAVATATLNSACQLRQRASLKGYFANSTNAQQPDSHMNRPGTPRPLPPSDTRPSRRYQGTTGLRLATQYDRARCGVQGYFPAHPAPPPARPALVLAV